PYKRHALFPTGIGQRRSICSGCRIHSPAVSSTPSRPRGRRVPGFLFLITLFGAAAAWPRSHADTVGNHARQVIREALRAVERDSAPAIIARWSAQLGPDSSDRRTLLGLATAARLSYNDSTATHLYQRLLRSASGSADAYGIYARL